MARKKTSGGIARGNSSDSGGKAASGKAAAGKAIGGLSPNPVTNALLANFMVQAGGKLLRRATERGVLGTGKAAGKVPDDAGPTAKGRAMAQTLVTTAIARVATRSVPGAIVIGGGLLAKALYDRKKARRAAQAQVAAADDNRKDRA